jgi:hypothetical protein
MSTSTPRWHYLVASAAATVSALVVVVLGGTVMGNQSHNSVGPTIEAVPQISRLDRARIQATLDAMLEQVTKNPYPSPEPSPIWTLSTHTAPLVIQLGSATIQIPEGMMYAECPIRISSGAPRKTAGCIRYTDESFEPPVRTSILYIDPQGGKIIKDDIRAFHLDFFLPTLRKLDELATRFIQLDTLSVKIPVGAQYSPELIWTGNPYPGRASSGLTYADSTGISRLGFYADTGEIVSADILPQHEEIFADVIEALSAG